jgi:BlaI family transcriptional regulator, penicillinase repressor
MSKQNNQKPTDAEIEILAILWKHGVATVREIHEEINRHRQTAYTTTLKMLQIMTEKGLVGRDETNRAHVYRARLEREATERTFARELLQKVFGGSASQLVMRVLESKPSDERELAEIRKIIERAERSADNK